MRRIVFMASFFAMCVPVMAGPPFVTDDSEPVEYRHWEVYLSSMFTHNATGWNSDATETEVNYGVIPNLQLHLIPTFALNAPKSGPREVGFSDTELGAKYRFIQQTDVLPDVACFPLVELPTGDAGRGLGTGHPQVYLPI